MAKKKTETSGGASGAAGKGKGPAGAMRPKKLVKKGKKVKKVKARSTKPKIKGQTTSALNRMQQMDQAAAYCERRGFGAKKIENITKRLNAYRATILLVPTPSTLRK
jgi:hypothetical protein